MTIMNEDGTEVFVLMDCARCELAGRNPCDLNDCPRGLSECVPSSCLYYTEEWNNVRKVRRNRGNDNNA